MLEVNGKTYPMWSQFVEKKEKWVGGEMFSVDNMLGPAPPTRIIDVDLIPNGDDSAMICFRGEDYDCTSDVQYCGIGTPHPEYPDHLAIHCFFGMEFYIRQAYRN